MKFNEKLREIMLTRKLIAQDIYKGTYKKISVAKVRCFLNRTLKPDNYDIDLLTKYFGMDMSLFLDDEHKKDIFLPVTKLTKRHNPKKDTIPLLKVEGSCTFIGCNKPAVHNAHFTGIDQHAFGKGTSKKCSNLFVADLCQEHHEYFDQPKERKSERMASEFKTCILLSIERKLEAGRIIFKK